MTIDLHLLPSWPQSQDSLKSQMDELIQVANRLGLYDAATFLSQRFASKAEPPSEKEIEQFVESIRMPWILEQISRATDPDPDFDVVIVRAALERWGK